MAAYIVLTNWTQDGIQQVKESPGRLERTQKAFQDAGAELKAFYMAMGRYDMIAIVEAPDDATMARLALTVGRTGAVRTETLRAFTEEEYCEIIAALP